MRYLFQDATYGSDSNGGTLPFQPVQTIARILAILATFPLNEAFAIYLSGTNYNDWVTLDGYSNKFFYQWPATPTVEYGGTGSRSWTLPVGMTITQAALRGLTTIGTGAAATWTVVGGNVYRFNIGTGKTVDSLVHGWERTDIRGNHYGHLERVADAAAVATAAGAAGARGVFSYVSGTGVIEAYFGGANPNISGLRSAWCDTSAVLGAIVLTNCTNVHFYGIEVGPLPVYSGQFGWTFRCRNCVDCTFEDGRGDDCGAHCGPQLGIVGGGNLRCYMKNTRMAGLAPNGTYGIFNTYQANPVTDGQFIDCNFWLTRWLGLKTTAGSIACVLGAQAGAVGAMAANTQNGVYAHSSDGGTPIQKINLKGNTFHLIDPGAVPWVTDDAPAVAAGDKSNHTAMALQVDGGAVKLYQCYDKDGTAIPNSCIFASNSTSRSWSMRRVYWWAANDVATGGNFAVGLIHFAFGAANTYNNMEYCVFDFSISDGAASGANAVRAFSAGGIANASYRVFQTFCTMNNRATTTPVNNFRCWYDWQLDDKPVWDATGCILYHETTGTAVAFGIHDGGLSVANHIFMSNLYGGVDEANARWSQVASIDIKSEWFASVDTGGTVGVNVIAVSPFVSSATADFNLTTAAKALKSTNHTRSPSGLSFNMQPFARNYGAYQYPTEGASLSGRLGSLAWSMYGEVYGD